MIEFRLITIGSKSKDLVTLSKVSSPLYTISIFVVFAPKFQ